MGDIATAGSGWIKAETVRKMDVATTAAMHGGGAVFDDLVSGFCDKFNNAVHPSRKWTAIIDAKKINAEIDIDLCVKRIPSQVSSVVGRLIVRLCGNTNNDSKAYSYWEKDDLTVSHRSG